MRQDRPMIVRFRANIVSLMLAGTVGAFLSACDSATLLSPPTTASFAKTGTAAGSPGGGGGGGTATTPPAACSFIRTFDPKPGFYPGNKLWGALWVSLSLQNCGPNIRVYALLSAVVHNNAFPWGVGMKLGYTPLGDGQVFNPATIDIEPVSVSTAYDVKVEVHDAATDAIVETRILTVTTPDTPVGYVNTP
jgi:hypothetical protein